MNSKKIVTSIFICLLYFTCLFNYTSFSENNSENIDFSVDIILPKNQTNQEITYFDFFTSPSEKQDLEIIVSNTGKEKKQIRITPTNAITNNNGIVDYSKQEKNYEYDITLTTPFTSLVSEEQIVTVEPGESQTLIFQFTAPKETFNGIILGGFVVDLVEDSPNDNTSKSGIQFTNKFQYVKAAVIRSKEDKIEPKIILNSVQPALHNYKMAITANLQNTAPVLLGNVKVEAEIFEKKSQTTIRTEIREDIQFAPNSNFDFPIMWNDERLEPGDYTMDMTIKANEETFTFSEDFTITKAQSNSINNEAIELKKKEISIAVWLVIIFFFILIVSVLIFVLYKQKNKNKALARDIKIKRNESIKRFMKNKKK